MNDENFNKELCNINKLLRSAAEINDPKEMTNAWTHIINIISKLMKNDLSDEQLNTCGSIMNTMANVLGLDNTFDN